jgi:hypothetical protein
MSIWFYLKHRGKTPRLFIRDNYIGLTQTERQALDHSFRVISDLLGSGEEPDGIYTWSSSLNSKRWKGFLLKKENQEKLSSSLIYFLGPPGPIPPGLKIHGYDNLPKE